MQMVWIIRIVGIDCKKRTAWTSQALVGGVKGSAGRHGSMAGHITTAVAFAFHLVHHEAP